VSKRSGNGVAAPPTEPADCCQLSPHMRNFFVVAHAGPCARAPAPRRCRPRPARRAAHARRHRARALGARATRLARVTVLNGRSALVNAHDKLATAVELDRAGVPHPQTVHVAPWLPDVPLEPPLVFKPRFGSWGVDVLRCDRHEAVELTLAELHTRSWFEATGGIAQALVTPRGFDLRVIVCRGRVVGAIRRVVAHGEWRTNVALGGTREPVRPPDDACDIALAAARATGGDLVGVDLLPDADDGWIVAEVNGAVDFTGAYSLGGDVSDVFAAVRSALLASTPYAVLAAV
jgi:[lysine-biosynthesis-protein LysW]--L-2-aminoadipate ligase